MSDSEPKDRVGLPDVPAPEPSSEPVTMEADEFVELQPTDPSVHVDNIEDFVFSAETMYEAAPERVALLRAHRRWRAIIIAGIVLVTTGIAGALLYFFRGRLGIG